jgi:hypothetical protein
VKIQKRLGNPDYENTLELYLPKPKRMRWKTYDRIVAQTKKPWLILESETAKHVLWLYEFAGIPFDGTP